MKVEKESGSNLESPITEEELMNAFNYMESL